MIDEERNYNIIEVSESAVTSVKCYLDAGVQSMEDYQNIWLLSPPCVGCRFISFCGRRYPFPKTFGRPHLN